MFPGGQNALSEELLSLVKVSYFLKRIILNYRLVLIPAKNLKKLMGEKQSLVHLLV